jgi:paraquat-inducible protein B
MLESFFSRHDVHVGVVRAVVLADDHALVHVDARAEEELMPRGCRWCSA